MSLERLSNEAIDEQSLTALEHRHRYEFAAAFCEGLRVVDLCCGVGYGSAILAGRAAEVRGIDVDATSIDEAERAHGALDGVSFEVGDAVEWLRTPGAANDVDVLVCFEGIEHLAADDLVLEALARMARSGTRMLLSMPNSRRFEEDNDFHLTNFDRDAVDRWAARLGADAVLGQWNAEGTLIAPEGEDPATGVMLEAARPPADRRPEGWAMHYLVLVNLPDATAPGARMAWTAEPANARWAESLQRGNREMWVENARLETVQPRGIYSAGAAAALKRWRHEGAVEELEEREQAIDRREKEVGRREVNLRRWEDTLGRRGDEIARLTADLEAWEGQIKQRERAVGMDDDATGADVVERLAHRTRELEAQRQDREALTQELVALRAVRERRIVRLALGGAAVLRRLRGGAR